jgi:hypothetical protein
MPSQGERTFTVPPPPTPTPLPNRWTLPAHAPHHPAPPSSTPPPYTNRLKAIVFLGLTIIPAATEVLRHILPVSQRRVLLPGNAVADRQLARALRLVEQDREVEHLRVVVLCKIGSSGKNEAKNPFRRASLPFLRPEPPTAHQDAYAEDTHDGMLDGICGTHIWVIICICIAWNSQNICKYTGIITRPHSLSPGVSGLCSTFWSSLASVGPTCCDSVVKVRRRPQSAVVTPCRRIVERGIGGGWRSAEDVRGRGRGCGAG